jgi:uncharacterized membrane protein
VNSTAVTSVPDEAQRPSVPRGRFQWLDTLKGVALIAMASYHTMWDLADFGYLDAAFPSTGWPRLYARAIASSFLLISGFSLVLAHGNGIRWKSFGKRLAIVIGAAALVTVATYFVIPQGFIFFGILHEIALASVIGLLFLRLPWPMTVLAAAIIIALPNYYLQPSDSFNAPWLWWVGLSTRTHTSFDYVPVLPWLGAFLLGVALGKIGAIRDWLRQNARGITPAKPWTAPLAFLGRHSLVFYLVHQPVLISILYVFSLVVPAPQVPPATKYVESCEMTCKPDRDANFCRQFCSCTLKRLQQTKLLVPFQSGAISVDDDVRIKDIAVECTALSQ